MDISEKPIAMAYVPWQKWRDIYDPRVGYRQGTIFKELDKPFLGHPVRTERGGTRYGRV